MAEFRRCPEHGGGHHVRLVSRSVRRGRCCSASSRVPRSRPGICRGKRRSRSRSTFGSPGKHEFTPKQLRFETGKLYKLILRNDSNDPHYFTSHAFSQMVWTRKVQVTQQRDGKSVTLAEFKGAMREIEVYPGQSAEWWLVPVAAGRATDLRCDIKGADGKTHADLGMTGEIVIE